MVKIIFMAKETLSSKYALKHLCNNRKEVEIIGVIIRNSDYGLREICEENHIIMYTEKSLKSSFEEGTLEADYILSFYWKKIGQDILEIPRKGSINFHPGPLPEARGSGYHAAILGNWGYWGVTAHFMDDQFDTGAVIECRHFPIDDDIVNRDLVKMTHEHLYMLFQDVMSWIIQGKQLEARQQGEGVYFSLNELESEKLICDIEDIETIDKKIRAFWNPPYRGAQVEVKGKRYTLINDEILKWIAERIK